jgi:hypothetical protein
MISTPRATEDEVRTSALHMSARSGFTKASQANAETFERGGRVAMVSARPLGKLVTNAPP